MIHHDHSAYAIPSRRHVRGMTLPRKERKDPRGARAPIVCARCYRNVDRVAIQAAIDEGRGYVHACGRVMVDGR